MNVITNILQFVQQPIKRRIRHTKPGHNVVYGTMVKPLLIFMIFASPAILSGQVGANVKALFGQSDILDIGRISQNVLHTSVEYAFRLKKKRVEFHPALGYRFTVSGNAFDGHINAADFDFHTTIYPFDFGGDCDCPTFSKEGDVMKKGFFLELVPGVTYQILNRLRSDPDQPSRLPIRSKNMLLKLGGAAGLDIGLSEQFTLTPMFSATLLSSAEWEGLHQDASAGKLDDFIYLGAGVRLSYKPDPKRRRRF